MDPIQVPEELDGVSDEDLGNLYNELTEGVDELREGDITDDVLADLEKMAEAVDRIRAEQATRAERAQERAARRDAALDRITGSEPEAPETVTEPTAEETEPEETEGLEAPTAEDEDEDREPEAVAASGASRAIRRPADLARRRPSTAAPRATEPDEAVMVASAQAPNVRAGTRLDMSDVANEIAEFRRRMGHVPAGTQDFVRIATGDKGIEHQLGSDPVENFHVLQQIRNGRDAEGNSLVAAGAFCTPLSPIYDFFRMAEAQSPVEDRLSTVQAPRGGIRFITPPDFNAGHAGLGLFAHDYDDYDPTDDATLKPCVRVACPPLQDEYVSAVTQCVTFGNLQYRTFPEQVEAFLADLAVLFASKKEVFYLDRIHGESTVVTGANVPYGALRRHIHNAVTAATGYRLRNGMRIDATLDAFEPSWLREKLALDLVMDQESGIDNIGRGRGIVDAAYRDANLNVSWYNDSATGAQQKFNTHQAAGNINKLPAISNTYLHAPGTFVRLDAGSLDVGLVRDSALNRSNDLMLFMEEFIGLAMVGLEAVNLVDVTCANGAAPLGVTPYTC